MFFVSVDSKKLSHFVSLLFSTLTSKSTSVDSKGLALHQNCAEKSCFSFVFKRIRRGTLKWRDLIPRLTGRSARNRAGLPECDYTSGLLKVKRKRGSGSVSGNGVDKELANEWNGAHSFRAHFLSPWRLFGGGEKYATPPRFGACTCVCAASSDREKTDSQLLHV